MSRFIKDRTSKKGLAPGSLVFVGNRKMESPQISLMDYDEKNLTESVVTDLEQLRNLKSLPTVSWINVYGIHDTEVIQKLGEIFDIPSLLLEDILVTDQRPKFEEGEKNLGFIMKMLTYETDTYRISDDQISFVLGKNYVLSFQEKKASFFDPVRERIRSNKGRVRTSGSDYLLYVLMDTIVDHYLDIIAQIGDKIEELGNLIITKPDNKIASDIYQFKVEMNYLRKNIRPAKELLMIWLKSDRLFVNKKTMTYLNDLTDLVTQAEESIEIYNNLLIDGLNVYNTNNSNRANDIMKVLTIFAAVFIPLTFLAGIYGMNFEYIPELGFRYSYPIFWGVVLLIGGGLFVFFKRRKWL
ncbi:MAG: magnesium/cobalt transporter CorA [Bacteroidales bacterium]|nr:magnesium/cobalt transporter CorA [Bacteroidales bacterium]